MNGVEHKFTVKKRAFRCIRDEWQTEYAAFYSATGRTRKLGNKTVLVRGRSYTAGDIKRRDCYEACGTLAVEKTCNEGALNKKSSIKNAISEEQ
ncbi:hypothetical protein PCI56_08655 [Plesiomonas shigelloides subsp. oncorhynchi]|nr:hypothetical protein [Plesiomonas shigelloides]